MSVMLTPAFLQEAAYTANEEVINPNDPVIPDRQAYPFLSMLMKRKQAMTFTRGQAVLKLQKNGGLELEHWDGRQVLTFEENRVDAEMTFTPRRSHVGVEFVHTQLEDEGYIVEPNAPRRGKTFAKKIPGADVYRIMDILKQRIDDMDDSFDVQLNEVFHLDGTHDSLAPLGLDALLPLDNTSGDIGGQPRTDPLFQHNVVLNSGYGAGDNLERDLQQLVRDCQRNNRGTPSRIDYIKAGEGWVDRYVQWARANDMPYKRIGGDSAAQRVDIGIPDSAIHFNGIPVVLDPTHEDLDAAGLYSGTPWTRRAYFLASKTWMFGYQTGKLKKFSAPLDPGDQRITRMSLEGRHVLLPKKPNGNGVHTFAA